MLEKAFPGLHGPAGSRGNVCEVGVVGFLVANIKPGAEQGNKDPATQKGVGGGGLAPSGMGMVIWEMGVLLQEPSRQKEEFGIREEGQSLRWLINHPGQDFDRRGGSSMATHPPLCLQLPHS